VPLRIGLMDRFPSGEPVHADCAEAVREAARALEELGHSVEPGHPPALDDPDISRHIGRAGAGQFLLSLANVAEVLGREVTGADVEPSSWGRARNASGVSALEQAQAAAACVRFRRAVHRWWADGHDLLLTPTLGFPPAPLGAFARDAADPRPHEPLVLRHIAFTRPFNITGQPAISLPLHWNADGLPIGVQLVAAYGREDLLVQVAAQLERSRPWAHRTPPAPVV
jgi:amidase